MRLLVLLFCTLATIATVSALSGCKQGLGERCQIDTDCKSPLICVSATNTCQDGLGTGIDAAPPIDAPLDAAPIDAPTDTPID